MRVPESTAIVAAAAVANESGRTPSPGGESAIPALEAVLKYGGQYGVEEVVIGMAHRGRLNVLTNVMAKPYRALFSDLLETPAETRTEAVEREPARKQ